MWVIWSNNRKKIYVKKMTEMVIVINRNSYRLIVGTNILVHISYLSDAFETKMMNNFIYRHFGSNLDPIWK